MTAVAERELTFTPEMYRLPVPEMDGRRAVKLELRFSGAGLLDATSADDLAILEAARLGEPVRLLVVGEFSGKGFRLNRNSNGEGELSYSCTVKVLSVEAGELA